MESPSLAKRTLVVVATVVFAAAAVLLIWYAADVLLLAFAGIILALLLRAAADTLADHTPLPPGIAVALVVLSLAGLMALGGWLLADDIAFQADQLIETLPTAVERLREWLGQREWGRFVLAERPTTGSLISLARSTGALSTTLGATIGVVANVVIVLFITLYVAIDPTVYERGFLRLVPPGGRPRARQVLHALGTALRRWFIGRLLGMAIIGVLTGLGLWLIGVPLALMLGLLAGLLNFVPYIGPIIAFVPAALLALMQSQAALVWVFGLYVAIQTLESYLVTPLVAQRSVSLPPALTIIAQVLLGILLGWLGLLLATPLTAAVLVLVKMLYIEDILGDDLSSGLPASTLVRQARG